MESSVIVVEAVTIMVSVNLFRTLAKVPTQGEKGDWWL
jgi:hypothetical protein